MPDKRDEHFKTALQIFAIVCIVGLLSMVFHKAFIDVAVMW